MALPRDIQQILDEAAGAYGANSRVLGLMTQYESGGRNVVNDWDSNAKAGTPSAGILQFIKPTFDAFARQAKAANPSAWKGVPLNWRNPRAQALATAWAITNGKGSHWTTYQRALKGAKGGPVGPKKKSLGLVGGGEGSILDQILAEEDPEFAEIRAKRKAAAATIEEAHHEGDGHDHGGGAPVRAGGGFKGIIKLGNRFGLTPGSTTGGRHAAGSYHYSGRAVDFGDAANDRAKLMALARYARANPGQFREFFYDPAGFYIKNGKVIKGAFGGHGDHAHAAW